MDLNVVDLLVLCACVCRPHIFQSANEIYDQELAPRTRGEVYAAGERRGGAGGEGGGGVGGRLLG